MDIVSSSSSGIRNPTLLFLSILVFTSCAELVLSSPRCIAMCQRSAEDQSLCKRCFREPMRFGKRSEKNFREPMRFGKRYRFESDGSGDVVADENEILDNIRKVTHNRLSGSDDRDVAIEINNHLVPNLIYDYYNVIPKPINHQPNGKQEMRRYALSIISKLHRVIRNLDEDKENGSDYQIPLMDPRRLQLNL